MELTPKGQPLRLLTLEDALIGTMVVLPEHCSGQQEAAMHTARKTAVMLARFIALMHRQGLLGVNEDGDDAALDLVPGYELSPYPED